MAGPLDGVLVVDLTRALAGPHAAMMLGDLGARAEADTAVLTELLRRADVENFRPGHHLAPPTLGADGAAIRAWLSGDGPTP